MTAPQSDLPEADLLDVDLPEVGLQETAPPEVAPAAAFEMPETAQDIPEQDLSELADVDLTEPAPLEADAHDQNTADTDLGLPDLGTPDLIDPELVAADPAEAEPPAESPVAEEVGESAPADPKPLVIEIPDEAEPQAPQASGVLTRLAGVDHLPADHMAEVRACQKDGFQLDTETLLIGTDGLTEFYGTALEAMGVQSRRVRGTQLVWPALYSLAVKAGLIKGNQT